jgi:hypothetical protein
MESLFMACLLQEIAYFELFHTQAIASIREQNKAGEEWKFLSGSMHRTSSASAHHEMRAPVLLPAILVVLRAHGALLTEADRVYAIG